MHISQLSIINTFYHFIADGIIGFVKGHYEPPLLGKYIKHDGKGLMGLESIFFRHQINVTLDVKHAAFYGGLSYH